jgi:hypothetical protein
MVWIVTACMRNICGISNRPIDLTLPYRYIGNSELQLERMSVYFNEVGDVARPPVCDNL